MPTEESVLISSFMYQLILIRREVYLLVRFLKQYTPEETTGFEHIQVDLSWLSRECRGCHVSVVAVT